MSSNRSNPDDIIPLLRNEMDVSYSHAPVSPKTLAFERLKLDIDELGASQRLNERIAFVETELNHLQTSWKSSAQTAELWTAHALRNGESNLYCKTVKFLFMPT
jgi:hypothetical protein